MVIFLGLLFFGCLEPESDDSSNVSSIIENTSNVSEQIEVVTPAKARVLFFGRSLGSSWMEYLGLEHACIDEPCTETVLMGRYDDYDFIYYELGELEDPMPSVIEGLELSQGKYDVVLFKFSQSDFGEDESGVMLDMKKRILDDVYREVVSNREKKLIVANAISVAEASPEIVSSQREYNIYLNEFASTHDVKVLDLYGTLVDSGGSLKSEYGSSHLNDAAYEVLTPKLLALIERA